MRRIGMTLCCIAWAASPLQAASVDECVQMVTPRGGEPSLTNVCMDRLNLMICVDHPDSPRSCAHPAKDIVTLDLNGMEPLGPHAADGAGRVHWAVCVYPEAPVGWRPGPASPYSCKKTCVMC
jgi:hypothetical protein